MGHYRGVARYKFAECRVDGLEGLFCVLTKGMDGVRPETPFYNERRC